jgi:hypothetical protein
MCTASFKARSTLMLGQAANSDEASKKTRAAELAVSMQFGQIDARMSICFNSLRSGRGGQICVNLGTSQALGLGRLPRGRYPLGVFLRLCLSGLARKVDGFTVAPTKITDAGPVFSLAPAFPGAVFHASPFLDCLLDHLTNDRVLFGAANRFLLLWSAVRADSSIGLTLLRALVARLADTMPR